MASIGNYFRSSAIIKAFKADIAGKDTSILDIGAGSCHIAKTLSYKYKLDVTAIDVVDHNITDFPLKLYDGIKLPYKDNSFDVGLLIFVLHHAPNVGLLISEAGRVCKKLIVVEDLPGNKLERYIWKHFDYLVNHARHSDIDVAHKARAGSQWKKDFNQLGYNVQTVKRFRSFFTTALTYPHAVFVLKSKSKN